MRIDRYIIMLLAIVTMAGCSSPIDESVGGEGQSGSLLMSVDMTRSGATSSSDDLLEAATLRIFNSQDGLVRYYKDLREDVIDYLAVGDYSAKLTIGEAVYATFNAEEVSFDGECDIEVKAQKTTDITIDVTMQNTVTSIVLDKTLASHYTGYYVCIYAANSVAEITDETPQLKYTESGDGYIIVDGDVENLVWQFCSDNGVEAQGIIEGAERAHQYQLTFKHTDYLDISGMTISIEGEETHDDIFGFKLQPVIKGDGFEIGDIQNYIGGESYQLSIASLFDITTISATVGEKSYTLGTDSELSYDTSTNILTMKSDIFDAIAQAGVNDVIIAAQDSKGSNGYGTLKVGIAGFIGVSNEDFWKNTATISWYFTTPASQVNMNYRESEATDWCKTTEATTTDGGHTWSAETVVEWASFVENNITRYQFKNGYSPSTEYEYQIVADGGEPKEATHTSSKVEMVLPSLAVTDSYTPSCYSTSNSDAEFWASGNNTMLSALKTLCSYDSSFGGAYLESKTAVIAFAAGNLFSGTFEMDGTTGTASFGQKYDWVARPKSLKFNYKVTVGSGDRGRVFIAIVDWSSRHSVATDSGGTATGSWDPTTMNEVTEGDIIGYGSYFFDDSQSTTTEHEIPIYYYDKEAKPTSGNYTIAISCSASWDGEHLNGSSDSRLWLKDFKFEY